MPKITLNPLSGNFDLLNEQKDVMLDTVFQLAAYESISKWSTGNNASFLGGGTLAGTFAKETVAPLNGKASYKYTQAAGSLNDYIASPVQDVAVRFRGTTCTLYFPFLYNGAATDIEVMVYDVTNSALIPSSQFIQNATANSIFKTNVTIPLTCTQIRVGFMVRVANSGAVLQFDDIQLTSDTTVYADIWNQLQTLALTSTVNPPVLTNGTIEGTGLFSVSGNILTALKKIEVTASISAFGTSTAVAAALDAQITPSNSTSKPVVDMARSTTSGQNMRASVTYSGVLKPGDTLTFVTGSTSVTLNNSDTSIVATASNPNILTAPDTFSTDTAPLNWGAGTYNLSTLSNAPIGTYIVFEYAANTNVRVQNTVSRPTQTDADMNVNGIRIFTRAYNAASNGSNPACIAIQIGKGLKGINLSLYKNIGKVTSGELDANFANLTEIGALIKSYNENTGILIVDSGQNISSTTTTKTFTFSDNTGQNNGYLVINASRNPALTGLNIGTVAARGLNTSGQIIGNTPTVVTWDAAKTFDTTGSLNAATGVFTAPETGYYQISAFVYFASGAYAAGQGLWCMGYKNNALYSYGFVNRVSAAITIQVGSNYSDTVFLTKGNTFEIRAQNQRGNTALDSTANLNFFSITKVSVG